MKMSIAEKRQIENEMIFRRANEKVVNELDAVETLLDEVEAEETDSNMSLIRDDKVHFKFLCECSDENCKERITIELDKYHELHTDRDRFIVKPHHQVESIEEIILTAPEYYVVQKNKLVSDPGDALNKTTINNT